MNTSMFEFWLKQTLGKALSSGGVTVIEELAESLTVEQLGKFVDILKKVLDRKKNVVG